MRRALFVLAAALAGLESAHGHICLTSPMMRGAHPPLYPGDKLCYQRTPPCGALVKGPPTATYIAGNPTVITFMQNLNHWWTPKPGHFDLAVSYDDGAEWVMLGEPISDFPANNMNTQTFLNIPVVFPKPAASALVRARYISHNENEVDPANNTDAIFYSCSDVEIIAPGGWGPDAAAKVAKQPAAPKAREEKRREQADVDACVAPPAFVATGTQYDFRGLPIMDHAIAYDSNFPMVRWDRNNTAYGGGLATTDYWNLTLLAAGYTPQYIYGLEGPGTCRLYGGDKFTPWQFGPQNGMVYDGNSTDNEYMHFSIPSNAGRFTARAFGEHCVPAIVSVFQTEIRLEAHPVQSVDSSLFKVPAVCTQTLPDAGCWAHRLGTDNA
ncbi:hypothetical protein DIPPA_06027 [Diplonema papillatum]|nr:hypothetical protein DIPPA_06027 [Diplonema papillatum]